MRLFVAIPFPLETAHAFYRIVTGLKEGAVSGAFPLKENLHLTLAFLGETAALDDAKQVVTLLEGEAFPLAFRGLGRFRQNSGDLWWMGAENSQPLFTLQKELARALGAAGFHLDSRPFRPHVTLGRRVVLDPAFSISNWVATLPEISMAVTTISLMESRRIQGHLTYSPLAEGELGNGRQADGSKP